MRLLVDSDFFCIFATAGLLESVAEMLGGNATDLQRLPALPHMLGRGKLRKRVGAAVADTLRSAAARLPPAGEAPAKWLDMMVGIVGIDPGEAQLLALTAEDQVLLLTGDKRALRALKEAAPLLMAIAEKVIIPEAALLGLCSRLGVDQVRQQLEPARRLDKTLEICFSKDNQTPVEALTSYLRSHDQDLAPLKLWHPKNWSNTT